MGTFHDIFGPLTKEHCDYFLFFSILGFILLIISIATLVFYILQNGRKANLNVITNIVVIITGYFLAYYSNRILYTICKKM